MSKPTSLAHGILLLDKPVGVSSHHALKKAQRLLGFKKAGHLGTLDVMASGMLPVCFGESTRFAAWGLSHDKQYTVHARMGQATETGDVEGEVIETAHYQHLNRIDLETRLPKWVGQIAQIPPMYSALKHKGEPLYALARRGEYVERPPREVMVHGIELLSWDMPYWSCRIHAGKGLYVRTLIEDLAKMLGSCAHVTALHRDWVAPWQHHAMVTLEALAMRGSEALIASQSLFQTLPTLTLDRLAVQRISQGLTVALVEQAPGLCCLQTEKKDWLGLGCVDGHSVLRVKRLFSAGSIAESLARLSPGSENIG